MWKVPAWGLTFQLPQQTVIIRIASQGIFPKCSSFQSSHLIVTDEFTPFWFHLQLDHPVTCENIKCYSHIQILAWIKRYNFFNNQLPLTPESDQHVISPFNIIPESNIKVMRIKEIIINWRTSWLLNEFSLPAHWEMYREQYGEYAYWC